MVTIKLENAGKRFGYEWIFRGISTDMSAGERWVLLGNNGSGKSTLLQVLSGFRSVTEGEVFFYENEQNIAKDSVYAKVSIATPYTDLIEDFKLKELISFHLKFKNLQNKISDTEFLNRLQLPKSAIDKEIRFFSSGMKQRVRLALAICSDSPILLLDEPTSNLDKFEISWYQQFCHKLF